MVVAQRNRVLDGTKKDDYPSRNAQEMDYKNHQIEVSVRSVRASSGWTPEVFVTYIENGKNVL
jgi:hypothetical protein